MPGPPHGPSPGRAAPKNTPAGRQQQPSTKKLRKQPQPPPHLQDVDESAADRLDRILEERYARSGGGLEIPDSLILTNNDTGNLDDSDTFGASLAADDDDDTFGDASVPVDTDFDFAGNTASLIEASRPSPGRPGSSKSPRGPGASPRPHPQSHPLNHPHQPPSQTRSKAPSTGNNNITDAEREHRQREELQAAREQRRLLALQKQQQPSAPAVLNKQSSSSSMSATSDKQYPSKAATLEEIEAQMLRQARPGISPPLPQQYHQQSPQQQQPLSTSPFAQSGIPYGQFPGGSNMPLPMGMPPSIRQPGPDRPVHPAMSIAEVEDALRAGHPPPQVAQPPSLLQQQQHPGMIAPSGIAPAPMTASDVEAFMRAQRMGPGPPIPMLIPPNQPFHPTQQHSPSQFGSPSPAHIQLMQKNHEVHQIHQLQMHQLHMQMQQLQVQAQSQQQQQQTPPTPQMIQAQQHIHQQMQQMQMQMQQNVQQFHLQQIQFQQQAQQLHYQQQQQHNVSQVQIQQQQQQVPNVRQVQFKDIDTFGDTDSAEEELVPANIESAVDSLTEDPDDPLAARMAGTKPRENRPVNNTSSAPGNVTIFDMDDFPVLAGQPGTGRHPPQHGGVTNTMSSNDGDQNRQFLSRRDRPNQHVNDNNNNNHRQIHQHQYRGGHRFDGNNNNHANRGAFDSNPSTRNDRYAGLMRKHEKELIAKIQISNLVTDDPLKDDYYYQVFMKMKNERARAAAAATNVANTSSVGVSRDDRGDGGGSGRPITTSDFTWQQASFTRSGHDDTDESQHHHGSYRSGGSGRYGRRRDGGGNAMNSIQQQLRRLIENRKQKPRDATKSLVGALGKISVMTVWNPKQAIQFGSFAAADGAKGRGSIGSASGQLASTGSSMSDLGVLATDDTAAAGSNTGGDTSTHESSVPDAATGDATKTAFASTVPTALSTFDLLRGIEAVYTAVIDLEMIKIRETDTKTRSSKFDRDPDSGNNNTNIDASGADSQHGLTQTHGNPQQLAVLWSSLRLSESVPLTSPHAFVCYLNCTKGMRVIPRAVRFLTHDQTLVMFSTMLTRFELLDISHVGLGVPNTRLDTFMSTIMPVFVMTVSDSPLSVVNSLVRIVLERHNVMWFVSNRVGMSILNVVLSRAEMLKQGGSTSSLSQSPSSCDPVLTGAVLPKPSDQDLGMWGEIYDFLFQSIQGHFASLFPKPVTQTFDKNATSTTTTTTTSSSPVSNPEETAAAINQDQHLVWQFMSAMAVGASGIDHQRILVTEVREQVIQTSKSGDLKALDNVNLFLHALGLGISAAQLAAMQI